VAEGEILGLLGPNGSGKSTTMNCILALLKFDGGKIKIFGKNMEPNAYDIKSKIGVVFQDVAVFDELTVQGNIDYFCGLYIKDRETRAGYVDDAIKLVGLEDCKTQYPKQLSGGLLRRLNIACGIAHKPKLIFLDEPTVAVDPQSRNNILEGIKKLRNDGATIVYTTHYMEEVEILCDRIIILDKGQIIASGTSDELKALANIEEKVTVEIPEMSPKQIGALEQIKNVSAVSYENGVLKLVYIKGKNNLATMIKYLDENKIEYNKIFAERPTLNDVFLELTGKELRD
jgi:ABC-2 type transport system ATP-binding protein